MMKNELAQKIGAFGFWWSKTIKGNEEVLPSILEIIHGLVKYHC